MVIEQPGDDEPETFTCVLAIACDGGPHQMSELSSKMALTSERRGYCHICNRARTAQTDALKRAICLRLDLRFGGSSGWMDWLALPSETRTTLLTEERRRVAEGTSTANQEEVFQNQELEEESANDGLALPDSLPSGESGGSQTTERDGYVYIVTHEEHEGWVSIGKTRAPTERLGGYNRADPYRRYVMRHTVSVEDRHISESEAHAAAAAHETCEDSRGEWFQMPLESAIEILNEIGTPTNDA
jgi:hypothetical protein